MFAGRKTPNGNINNAVFLKKVIFHCHRLEFSLVLPIFITRLDNFKVKWSKNITSKPMTESDTIKIRIGFENALCTGKLCKT